MFIGFLAFFRVEGVYGLGVRCAESGFTKVLGAKCRLKLFLLPALPGLIGLISTKGCALHQQGKPQLTKSLAVWSLQKNESSAAQLLPKDPWAWGQLQFLGALGGT